MLWSVVLSMSSLENVFSFPQESLEPRFSFDILHLSYIIIILTHFGEKSIV